MKKFIPLFFALLAAPLSYVFAQAHVVITINPGLPGPYSVSTAGPCGWILNFYNFALIFAGILAFGSIVYGGFKYATSAGNAHNQEEGRGLIWSALLGVLLLAGVYLILYTINPNLVKCSLPSLSSVANTSGTNGGTTSSGGGGGGSSNPFSGVGGKCQAPASGPCSTAQLQGSGSCFSGNPQTAAGVCNMESSGNANAQGDKGDDGNFASIGLFQINLSANTIQDPSTGQTLNCPSAFSNPYTGSNPHTHVTNPSLYQQCVAAAKNPTTNIAKACSLSKSGTSWNLWGPATKAACGL